MHEVIMFSLSHATEIKDLPIQRTYSQTDVDKKNLYHSILNNILDEVILYIEQRFKTMGDLRVVELLNLKLFHTYKKKFQWKPFQFWMYIKTYWI